MANRVNLVLMKLAYDRLAKQADGMGGGMSMPGNGMGGGQPGSMGQIGGALQMPMMPQQQQGGGNPQKFRPEALDTRLYLLQQQMTAVMNHLGIKLDPAALTTPPGMSIPPSETAMPGMPMDPAMQAQAQGLPQQPPGGATMDPSMAAQQGIPPQQPGMPKAAADLLKTANTEYLDILQQRAVPQAVKVDAVQSLLSVLNHRTATVTATNG